MEGSNSRRRGGGIAHDEDEVERVVELEMVGVVARVEDSEHDAGGNENENEHPVQRLGNLLHDDLHVRGGGAIIPRWLR